MTTFTEPGLERRLARNGIAVLRGLGRADLDHLHGVRTAFAHHLEDAGDADEAEPVEVVALADSAWQEQMAPGARWRIGINRLPREDRFALHERMASYWQGMLDRLFVDHRVVLTSLLDKRHGPDGFLPLHQDPTMVDEQTARSVTLWIALDDIGGTVGNGALAVLPGSHLDAEDLRGPAIPAPYLSDLVTFWKRTVPVDVRAGDAIVWDARVVHGSGPNLSGRPRRAIVAVLAPRDEPLLHVAKVGQQVEVRTVAEDFYRRYSFTELIAAVPAEGEVWATAPLPTTDASHYLRRSRRFGYHHAALRREARR